MAASAKLEILVGPAGSGKSRLALEEYCEILAKDPLGPRRRGLWLAPTQAAANAIRDALAADLPGALLDPGVRTFARFAGEVVWDAGLRVSVISPLERRRLLRRAIAEAAADGKLVYFHRVAGSPGLVNLVDEAIASLKRRDVSADAFRQTMHGATPRQRDLAELYTRYESLLAAGRLTDPEGLFLAARDGIRTSAAVGMGIELIVVDGFTDFTAAQLEILRVISERARRVLVTLVGEPDGQRPRRLELFAKTHATRSALADLGPVAERRPAAPAHKHDRATLSPALVHLERNLFRNYGEIEPPQTAARQALGDLQIIAASSVQAEIEEIARRVKGSLLDGVRPEEIAVVFPSTREVAERVRGAFDDFGIPTRLDVRPRLASTALVRSLLGVLRIHAEDWPYRRLLQVIGDQSVQVFAASGEPAKWPLDGAGAASLAGRTAAEQCVRHAQLARGRALLLDQIATWSADDSGLGVIDSATAALAGDCLERLAQCLDQLPGSGSVEAWIPAVQNVATSLGLRSPSDARLWQVLTHGMRSIERVDAATGLEAAELRVDDFLDLLNLIANELPIPDDADAIGRVLVLSAEAARFIRPRRLFVGGLSEQAFAGARGAAAEDLEEEAPAAAAQSARNDEMLLFYQVVTRATESLTLSYPALDAKAQSMPPSPLLVELERCFGEELKEYRQPLAYQAKLEGDSLSRSDLRRQAVASAQERKRDLLAAMVRSPRYSALGKSLLEGIEAVASRGDRRRFGPYEGLFSSDEVQALLERKYGADFHWSPSLLETYAGCPFKFFSEQILKLAPMPELALESDPARRGSVLHDTLARLYGRLNVDAESGGPRPTPESVAERFQELLDAIVRGRPGRGLDGALRELERRQIAAWAHKFAEQHEAYTAAWQNLDAPLVPRYFEARFGPKNRRSQSEHDATLSTDEPYELAVGNERLRFTGTIDRIDVGRVGDTLVFNVIDYKTSASARLKPEQIESGTQIQLPLYAMAVAELLLADKQAAALSVGYWSVRGKGFSIGARTGGPLSIGEIRDGRVQMSAQWSQLRESLLSRIAEVVSGIRRGHFPVYSEDKTCTQYCPYSTCCRIAHVRALEKSWPPIAGEGTNESSGSLPLVGRAGEGGEAGTRS